FYMTRCWMLTFWGKPRNQHLYDHAHETPILWMPLAVLAVASIVGGYNWAGIRSLIESAQKESTALVKSLNTSATPTSQNPAIAEPNFSLFQTAWSTEAVGESAAADGESAKALEEGEHTMHSAVGFAW